MAQFNLMKPSKELEDVMRQMKESDNPFLFIILSVDSYKCEMNLNKSLMKKDAKNLNSDWKINFQNHLKSFVIMENEPYFVLFDINTDKTLLMLHVIPPKCTVRSKMALASIKSVLKNVILSNVELLDVLIEDPSDLKLETVVDHLESKSTSALSRQEQEQILDEKADIYNKISQTKLLKTDKSALGCDTKVDDDCINDLKNLINGNFIIFNYQLNLDPPELKLDKKYLPNEFSLLNRCFDYYTDNLEQIMLPSTMQPGYILFHFNHKHPETKEKLSHVCMVCYVPVEHLQAKLRFAYCFHQQAVQKKLEKAIVAQLMKDMTQVELLENMLPMMQIDDISDLTLDFVYNQVYKGFGFDTKQQIANEFEETVKFEKPKGRGRGPKRLIK